MRHSSNIHRVTRAFLALLLTATASAMETDRREATVSVTWLGQAAFEIVSPGGTRLLIDPWVFGNPQTPAPYNDTAHWTRPGASPAAILATHAHPDHDGDVPRLAKLTGARVVATGDHLEAMQIPDSKMLSINLGGVQRVGDVEINAVPAMHSSTPGRALGYVLRFSDGRTLYHTGDTWVFGDMELIARFFRPTAILMAAGGGRAGQDPEAAAFAVRRYFKPRLIVPMHFGSGAGFATEADVRAAFRGDPRLRVVAPGQETRF
jgi:L-ascorbate metabolism protein UlaG (beta-lactamase superfamily)